MTPQRGPQALALATVLLWSIGQTLGRIVSHRSSYAELVICFAFTFSTYVIYARRTGDVLSDGIKRLLKRPMCLVFASLGYFVYWLGVTHCNQAFSTAAEPMILNYMFPFFTVLFTELLFGRHRMSAYQRALEVAGLSLGFASMIMLATHGNVANFHVANVKGLLWGLLASASYGLFSAYSSTIEKADQIAFLVIACLWGLLGMAVATAITGIDKVHFKATDLLVIIALGTFVEGLGYITWTGANRAASEQGVSVGAATAMIYFLPVLSVIVGSVAFRETAIFRPYVVVAILLLVVGSVTAQRSQTRYSTASGKPL